MTSADSRKFLGRTFGLTISVPPPGDPGWPASYGDAEPAVNEFVYVEGTSILFEGGRLVLGHRWTDVEGGWNSRGVLSHFVAKSREFRTFRPAEPDAVTKKIPPAIINLLAWPDAPPPPSEEYPRRLVEEGVLEIRMVRPPGFAADFLDQANDPAAVPALLASPLGEYARLRALTVMRQELVDRTDFRICLGGPVGRDTRRLPGVIEEALLTARAGKPLYLSSAFGGVAKAMAECLLQRRIRMNEKDVFFTPPAVVELMKTQATTTPFGNEWEGPSSDGGWNALTYFQGLSLDTLAEQAGLTREEYIDLLATPNVERAMGWVMHGVRRRLASAQ